MRVQSIVPTSLNRRWRLLLPIKSATERRHLLARELAERELKLFDPLSHSRDLYEDAMRRLAL